MAFILPSSFFFLKKARVLIEILSIYFHEVCVETASCITESSEFLKQEQENGKMGKCRQLK